VFGYDNWVANPLQKGIKKTPRLNREAFFLCKKEKILSDCQTVVSGYSKKSD